MLSKADNELLTRVGPDTPMGGLMRQYWIPALISPELPDNDGAPLRVRLLGEDLIAFRDSEGRAGLLAANCPHRGASLYFGRNEASGLRCVYHGWKFDVTGACVDMPSEPAESNFRHKVQAVAYPCVERGGIVWTYMGQGEPPELPGFQSNELPITHMRLGRRYQETNWMQALEGGIDSAHGSFLHSALNAPGGLVRVRTLSDAARSQATRSPALQVAELPNGRLIGACREMPDGGQYWRTNLFMMPFYTQSPQEQRHFNAWVPMDDEHTLRVSIVWDPLEPITDERLAEKARGTGRQPLPGGFISPQDLLPATSQPGGAWRAKANRNNDYLLDYELQRTKWFFGVDHGSLGTQDLAVQESMGPVIDRSKEHLGTTDLGVIAARRMLLDSARALRDQDRRPPGVDEPDSYAIHAVAFTIPSGGDWSAEARERILDDAPVPLVER
jgi:phthalate 4,5-dioxygenase